MKTKNDAARQLVSSMKERKVGSTERIYTPEMYKHHIMESSASIAEMTNYLDETVDISFVLADAFAVYTKSLLSNSAIGVVDKERYIDKIFSFLGTMICAIDRKESLNDLYFGLKSLAEEE